MLNARKKTYSAEQLRYAEEVVNAAGILDDSTADILVQAFAKVPRENFLDSALAQRIYEDVSLPIACGQTTSRPSTIARMLGLVGIRSGMRVLEIGCGSGYGSAIMAAAGAYVFAVEYIGPLGQQTRRRLDSFGFQNVIVRNGDGRKGWAEHAPYDAIIMSAPFDKVEPELISQLANGGRMVAPIGNSRSQIMTLWEVKDNTTRMYQLEPCSIL